jgi:hypothetical protein
MGGVLGSASSPIGRFLPLGVFEFWLDGGALRVRIGIQPLSRSPSSSAFSISTACASMLCDSFIKKYSFAPCLPDGSL